MIAGTKLRLLRIKQGGMSQRQLAKASGLAQATISRLESGKFRQLKSDNLTRLAAALGTTVGYLVGKTAHLTPNQLLASDPNVGILCEICSKLSSASRRDLRDHGEYLLYRDGQGVEPLLVCVLPPNN